MGKLSNYPPGAEHDPNAPWNEKEVEGYGWRITEDHISDDGHEEGTEGPSGLPSELSDKLDAEDGQEFKMYDDDGVLYYEGLITGDYTGFEPLDDFGKPNAGCTDIMYWNDKTKEWETL